MNSFIGKVVRRLTRDGYRYFIDFGPLETQRQQFLRAKHNQSINEKLTVPRGKRTLNQNKLMWLDFEAVSQVTGYSKEEVYWMSRFRYLQTGQHIEIDGDKIPITRGTSDLDRMEFSNFVDSYRQYWREELNDVDQERIRFVTTDEGSMPSELREYLYG